MVKPLIQRSKLPFGENLERLLEAYCRPLFLGGTMTILTVSVMHFIQALCILVGSDSIAATATLALKIALNLLGSHHERWIIGPILVASSSMAALAVLRPVGRVRIFLLITQHLILGVMTVGCISAIWVGHYLDGTVVPRMHILTDQLPIIILFVFHTLAIIFRSWVQDE